MKEMPIDPQAVIAEAQAEAVRKVQGQHQMIAEYRREHDVRMKKKADFIRAYLRPARAEDYHKWLRGYILDGGILGNAYDRPTRTDEMFVAVRDIHGMPRLCGALAIEVIVPAGIRGPEDDGPQSIGHSTIYYMDGFRINKGSRPLVYNDIKF